MTRFTLSRSPRTMTWIWSVYALLTGILAFGAGYGAASTTDSAVVGVLTSLALTVASGWWAPPLLRSNGRMSPGPAGQPRSRDWALPPPD